MKHLHRPIGLLAFHLSNIPRQDALLDLQLDESGQKKVFAILEDGKSIAGDVLIGADGIWSKVGKS